MRPSKRGIIEWKVKFNCWRIHVHIFIDSPIHLNVTTTNHWVAYIFARNAIMRQNENVSYLKVPRFKNGETLNFSLQIHGDKKICLTIQFCLY